VETYNSNIHQATTGLNRLMLKSDQKHDFCEMRFKMMKLAASVVLQLSI